MKRGLERLLASCLRPRRRPCRVRVRGRAGAARRHHDDGHHVDDAGTTTVGTTTSTTPIDDDTTTTHHDDRPDAAPAARGRDDRRNPGRQPARPPRPRARSARTSRRRSGFGSASTSTPPNPHALATPKITKAIARAKRARAFANLGLAVAVKTVKVRTFVATLAPNVEKAPVDSHLILRNLEPYLTRERPGVALVQPATVNAVAKALRLNERGVVKLRTTKTKAEVTRKSFGPVIVIHRGSNRLYLYHGAKHEPDLPGRDRTERLPDAARQLPDRGHVAEPLVVPAELRLGEGRAAGSARARTTRSARAGWASPRPASASTARTTTHRSAIRSRTAASACTCTTPSGCSTTSWSGRRSSSFRPDVPDRRASAGGADLARDGQDVRSASIVTPDLTADRRAGAFGCARRRAARTSRLEGRASGWRHDVASEVHKGKSRRAGVHLPRLGGGTLASRIPPRQAAGRQLLGIVVRPVPRRGAAAAGRAREAYRGRLVVLGIDYQDFRGDARKFVRKYGLTYPIVRDGNGTSSTRARASPACPRRSSSTAPARSSRTCRAP